MVKRGCFVFGIGIRQVDEGQSETGKEKGIDGNVGVPAHGIRRDLNTYRLLRDRIKRCLYGRIKRCLLMARDRLSIGIGLKGFEQV